jgi:hypothetical protein
MSHLAVPSLRIAAIGAGSSSGDEVISSARVGKFASVSVGGTEVISAARAASFTSLTVSGNLTLTAGAVYIGTSVTAGVGPGDVVLALGNALRTANDANTQIVIGTTAAGHVQLAQGSANSYPLVPVLTNAALLAGDANQNGALVVDSTNNRLIYYSGGNRYHLTGTSF